jgi:hypothetical protein
VVARHRTVKRHWVKVPNADIGDRRDEAGALCPNDTRILLRPSGPRLRDFLCMLSLGCPLGPPSIHDSYITLKITSFDLHMGIGHVHWRRSSFPRSCQGSLLDPQHRQWSCSDHQYGPARLAMALLSSQLSHARSSLLSVMHSSMTRTLVHLDRRHTSRHPSIPHEMQGAIVIGKAVSRASGGTGSLRKAIGTSR